MAADRIIEQLDVLEDVRPGFGRGRVLALVDQPGFELAEGMATAFFGDFVLLLREAQRFLQADDFLISFLVLTITGKRLIGISPKISPLLPPGYVFSAPISLTVEYSDAGHAGISHGGSSLELRYWDGTEYP